jgi:hypothetical protein
MDLKVEMLDWRVYSISRFHPDRALSIALNAVDDARKEIIKK